MSNNKKYKLLTLKTKEDFVYVLFRLIIQVVGALELYKTYTSELEAELKPYLENGKEYQDSYIEAHRYESIHRRLHDVSSELMKYIADMQDSSISYNLFRKLAERNNAILSLPPLSEIVKKEIKELLDVRNWSFHNPQSLFVADKEKYEKQIPDELKKFIDWKMTFNPIKVVLSTKYDVSCLSSLYLHATRRIEVFNLVLDSMLKDYSQMLEQEVSLQIMHDPRITPLLTDSARQVQLSMAIQKGKYSGSMEDYRKITFTEEE